MPVETPDGMRSLLPPEYDYSLSLLLHRLEQVISLPQWPHLLNRSVLRENQLIQDGSPQSKRFSSAQIVAREMSGAYNVVSLPTPRITTQDLTRTEAVLKRIYTDENTAATSAVFPNLHAVTELIAQIRYGFVGAMLTGELDTAFVFPEGNTEFFVLEQLHNALTGRRSR